MMESPSFFDALAVVFTFVLPLAFVIFWLVVNCPYFTPRPRVHDPETCGCGSDAAWCPYNTNAGPCDSPTERAVTPHDLPALLLALIELTGRESSDGKWRVTLDYDNYQDGARVLDGDGIVLGECYDLFDDLSDDPEAIVRKQFLVAIERATGKRKA